MFAKFKQRTAQGQGDAAVRGGTGGPGVSDAASLTLLTCGLATSVLLSLLLGRYALTPWQVAQALCPPLPGVPSPASANTAVVVLSVRLPRIAADILVGAALSASGAAFQGIFKNPLVSPGILGVSAGAGTGAALGLLLGVAPLALYGLSFGFGLLAVLLSCAIASWRGGGKDSVLVLVLSGVIIGMVFSACISLIKLLADPYNVLPAITFWLLGSLAPVTGDDVLLAAGPILAGLTLLNLLWWNLNVLSLGDEEAFCLGINVRRMRLAIILGATLTTATAVAISGVIGLVGLIVPHLTRLVVGPNYKVLMPASTLMGAIFLLVVDDLARTLFVTEIPLGILTALIGAPFFISLLTRMHREWD